MAGSRILAFKSIMAPVEPALDACQLFSGFREEINSRLSRMNA